MRHENDRTPEDPPRDPPTAPDDQVDEAARDSFPASDPPAFAGGESRPPPESPGESAGSEPEPAPPPSEPSRRESNGRHPGEKGETGAQRRNIAGFVVVAASVWALVSAIRVPPDVMTDEGSPVVESVPLLMLIYAVAGLLGLGGLIAAQKWVRPARFIVGAGGLAMFAGFLTLQDFTLVSFLSLGLPGLLLLAAAPFVGVVPRSVDEAG